MTLSHYINSAGLVFDIVGATLLWRFGLPAEISRSGSQSIITNVRNHAEIEKAKRFDRISWWGFLSLVMGFVLQFLSNFVAR